MQHLVPHRVAGQEPLGRNPEQLLDIRAHRERHAAELGLIRVDRARDLSQQRLVSGLRFEGTPFGVAKARLEIGSVVPLHLWRYRHDGTTADLRGWSSPRI